MILNDKKKIFRQFDESRGLISDLVFIVKQDKRGRIWLCGDKGSTLISPGANTYQTLTEANGLSGSYSSIFLESNAGNIYLGSDNGFSILDQQLKTIINIGAKNGMLPPSLYDMTEWNKQVYIGTENGITIVAPPTQKDKPWHFYNYAKSAGFPYNDYNQATAFATSYGDVWWGAAPVLTVVHQVPTIDTMPPTVVIKGVNIMDQAVSFVNRSALKSQLREGDSIEIGGKKYGAASLPSDSGYLVKNNIRWDSVYTSFQLPAGLRLPYHQNSFNFIFANQSAAARDKIVYRFILEGEDDAWSSITDKPLSRNYYNIKPGHYTFKVISRGLNGVWSQPASFRFKILPPWWQTWWAFLLFALIAAAIIYIIVRVRSAMLQKENRLLEKKVHLRTEALHQKMEELKSAQNQLVQSEKMASLGELTAGIAHEIQNPLNFINNFSEINKELLTDMYDEIKKGDLNAIREIAANIQSNEEKIYHHGRRADGIVKSMLQHSRSNSNITKEPTDINKLADEYLRLAYHGLRARDKSFNSGMKTDFDESIPSVNMVPQDIGRVILNLLTNAFYAVNERSKTADQGFKPMVSINTKKINDKVEVVVTDNGAGIPKNIADKIFQPFFTTKPTGQGTGLGLSMSYDIVTKAHGGELKLKSQEGKGTEFSIVLPINN